jgi:hypothetical protein
LSFIELGVDEDPASLVFVPVLADPMVQEASGLEITGETATGPCRHILMTKKGAEEDSEVATAGHKAFRGWTRSGEGRIVKKDHATEHGIGAVKTFFPFPTGNGCAIDGGPHAVDEEPLNDVAEALNISGKLAEERLEASEIGEDAWPAIEGERLFIWRFRHGDRVSERQRGWKAFSLSREGRRL